MTVGRDDVVAFRLHAHHLDARLGRDDLLEAAGSCAVQDSPPGSALLALHARVDGLTRHDLEQAVGDDKSLLQTWCMRGAPFLFPTGDASVFTAGVLPPTEAAMAHFLPGVVPALRMLDLSLPEAAQLCDSEIRGVLAGRQLAIVQLGKELAAGRAAAGHRPAR